MIYRQSTDKHRQTVGQIERQTYKLTDISHTERHTGRKDKKKYKHIDKLTDRDRQRQPYR